MECCSNTYEFVFMTCVAWMLEWAVWGLFITPNSQKESLSELLKNCSRGCTRPVQCTTGPPTVTSINRICPNLVVPHGTEPSSCADTSVSYWSRQLKQQISQWSCWSGAYQIGPVCHQLQVTITDLSRKVVRCTTKLVRCARPPMSLLESSLKLRSGALSHRSCSYRALQNLSPLHHRTSPKHPRLLHFVFFLVFLLQINLSLFESVPVTQTNTLSDCPTNLSHVTSFV